MAHAGGGEQTPAAFQDAQGKLMLSDRFGRVWRVSERRLQRDGKSIRCRVFTDGQNVERIYCLRRGELIDTTVTGLTRQLEKSELAGPDSSAGGFVAPDLVAPPPAR